MNVSPTEALGAQWVSCELIRKLAVKEDHMSILEIRSFIGISIWVIFNEFRLKTFGKLRASKWVAVAAVAPISAAQWTSVPACQYDNAQVGICLPLFYLANRALDYRQEYLLVQLSAIADYGGLVLISSTRVHKFIYLLHCFYIKVHKEQLQSCDPKQSRTGSPDAPSRRFPPKFVFQLCFDFPWKWDSNGILRTY